MNSNIKEEKKIQRRKIGIIAALIVSLLIGTVFGSTFYLTFIQTPYDPNLYAWTEPWEVFLSIDYISAYLTITGSAFQFDDHSYELSFENVAEDPLMYLLDAFDYEVVWTVGLDEETLISGSFADMLLVGETVLYEGIFSPTISGIGDLRMNINNIVWTESEAIYWSYTTIDLNDVIPNYIILDSFTISGASTTYFETGQVQIVFSSPSAVPTYVTFDLTLPEIGTVNFDFHLETGTNDMFTYDFGPLTIGGDLTCTLTVITQHN